MKLTLVFLLIGLATLLTVVCWGDKDLTNDDGTAMRMNRKRQKDKYSTNEMRKKRNKKRTRNKPEKAKRKKKLSTKKKNKNKLYNSKLKAKNKKYNKNKKKSYKPKQQGRGWRNKDENGRKANKVKKFPKNKRKVKGNKRKNKNKVRKGKGKKYSKIAKGTKKNRQKYGKGKNKNTRGTGKKNRNKSKMKQKKGKGNRKNKKRGRNGKKNRNKSKKKQKNGKGKRNHKTRKELVNNNDLVKTKGGRKQKSFVVDDILTQTNVIYTPDEIEDAVLTHENPLITVKMEPFENDRSHYAAFKMNEFNSIRVYQFTLMKGAGEENLKIVESFKFQDIKRCYNSKSDCIAGRDGTCLKSQFSESITKILKAKNTTWDGSACSAWRDPKESGLWGVKGNMCLIRTNVAPWCIENMKTKKSSKCFDECNLDIQKLVVGPETPTVMLPMDLNTVVTLQYQANSSILVKAWKEQSKDLMVQRCYDKFKKCIATKNGPCLQDFLSDDILIVLSNKNESKTGAVCMMWDNSQDGIGNICSKPTKTDYYGPWCNIDSASRTYASCFDDCNHERALSFEETSGYDGPFPPGCISSVIATTSCDFLHVFDQVKTDDVLSICAIVITEEICRPEPVDPEGVGCLDADFISNNFYCDSFQPILYSEQGRCAKWVRKHCRRRTSQDSSGCLSGDTISKYFHCDSFSKDLYVEQNGCAQWVLANCQNSQNK